MADEYGMTSEERAGRRRMVLSVLLVALIAFFVLWYAMSYVRADGDSAGDGTASGSSSSGPSACSIAPKKVTVNVYNATDRTGLAGRIAKELRQRGFDVELVANDPKQAEVLGVGQLRHGKVTDPEARLLMKHAGELRDVQDQRTRETLDIVLGEKFQDLVPEREVGC